MRMLEADFRFVSGCFGVLALLASFSGSLQAQTFDQVPGLAFTKPFGGADPLPQTLTIATTGTAFNFSSAASTSSGGSWLSVSPTVLATTPHVLTATVTTSPALAAGTYAGQIVVTSQNHAAAMTIPVTLTVAQSVPFFDNLPGQTSFSLKTGGTSLTSQDIQVRNGGSGTLSWTLTKSTSDGGNWLTVSTSSGTAPSVTTVGVSVPNLPGAGLVAGTYVGQLVFQTAGSSVTVPVSVVVGDNILTQVNAIAFNKVFGGAEPLPQTLSIASTGTAFNFAVTYSTATGGNWLSVSPTVLVTAPRVITATVTAGPTLAVGTYTAQIVVTTQSGNMAITIPVALTVAPVGSAYFGDLAGQMSFSLKTAGNAVTAQEIEVLNGGSGNLNWTVTASTSDAGPWLSVSTPAGTAPSFVTVQVSVPNLPNGGLIAGTFVGELVFQAAGTSVTVPVSVVVGDSILSQVNAIAFTKVFGGADPLPQTLSIASTGAAFNFAVTYSTATGGSWLSVSPTVLVTTPRVVTATVNTSPTLAVGTYTAQIVVTSQSGNMALTIPVSLTVVAAGLPFFDNVPGQMSFTLTTGSTNGPPAQSIQIRNGAGGTLDWTLATSTSDGGNWLSASTMSGTAPSSVSISLSKQNLPGLGLVAGTFVGELVFRSSGGGSVTVAVSVVVGDSILNQVNAISFTKPFGGTDPLPQTLTIANTGTAFNFAVTYSTATGGNWLSVSPTVLVAAPHVITATVSASPTLAVGSYTAQIVATSQSGSMSITIPVTLTIAQAGPFLDSLPGQMSFSFVTAAGNPPAQTIQVRTGGLSWSLAATTSDGGNWLTTSASGGSAPTTVTVGITAASLPGQGLIAGTFTGELVLQSAGNTVSIPVSVVVGSNVFVQLAPLNFSQPFGGPNALAQTLAVASTGTAFNFSTSYATSTGGNWLSVSPTVLATTPHVSTATVSASPTLAPGTYTAQIVFTSQSGSMAMTVPVSLTVQAPVVGLRFVPVTPCRVADTRGGVGAFGGPTLAAGSTRSFAVPESACGIPNTAQAYSLNATVVPQGPLYYLTLWPTGFSQAQVSTLNSFGGIVVANAAVVPAGLDGEVSVYVPNATDLILDINGYFDTSTGPTSYSFYPATPCRVADTRGVLGTFGGPTMGGGQSRDFPIPLSGCGTPTTARAYSLNVTVVPDAVVQYLGYLTTWPTGQPAPVASTLNSWTGKVVANAALVPAGTNESISVYVSNPTDVILDINGYFGLPGNPGALSFYPVTPCRVADTRNPANPFGGPEMAAGETRSFPIPESGCGIPMTAAAYSMNVTVVPDGRLSYLSAWPTGSSQPVVSTLNSWDGAVVANAAIVPAGTNGGISLYTSEPTHVILDINGYFAP